MKNNQKRIITDLEITGMSAEGRGLGKVEGKVVFASFAVPGDVVDVEVRKSKKNYAEGVVANLKSASIHAGKT
jgi:23S rRNA (uracil1939-C5)-methyltransferase